MWNPFRGKGEGRPTPPPEEEMPVVEVDTPDTRVATPIEGQATNTPTVEVDETRTAVPIPPEGVTTSVPEEERMQISEENPAEVIELHPREDLPFETDKHEEGNAQYEEEVGAMLDDEEQKVA